MLVKNSVANSAITVAVVGLLIVAIPATAQDREFTRLSAAGELRAGFEQFREWKESNTTGTEFRIESEPFEGGARTTISLFIEEVDLDVASEALTGAGAWCELLFLHLNVKSCVHGPEEEWIKLYMGRKYYQPPKKAEQIQLDYRSGTANDGVSWVELSADTGPFGTSDYYAGLYAIDVDGGTFAEFRSSQKTSDVINTTMGLYFKTLGASKVGFSVIGTDRRGNPAYVGGTQGMMERNIVRYLLALRAYMLTHSTDGPEGMIRRAELWYDSTERYPEQLHEVDRDDYLKDKRREYQHQLDLQAELLMAE